MKNRILLILVFAGIVGFSSYAGTGSDKEVLKAFELRMGGKVDDARLLLEGILKKDSANAMANFEMARLKHYLLTGGGGIKIDDILVSINKAATYDPQNVTYAYYKAIVHFLNAFKAMQTGTNEVKKNIEVTCFQFKKVLSMKPDYHEAALYLVEIYGMLPKDMGGDSVKAQEYAVGLEAKSKYFGSRANAVLAAKGTDMVKFWLDRLNQDNKNADFFVDTGKAYLNNDDLVNAEKYFGEAIKSDPTKNILLLDMARYHMMVVMRNKDLAKTNLPLAKSFLERYLKTVPEPVLPLKAYAMGLLTRTEMFLGNKAEADKIMEEAKSLDKYFSRAMGIPTLLLFDSPEQPMHHYFSFFSPF
jgi:tetratricopeptide (TPR) repeat protein